MRDNQTVSRTNGIGSNKIWSKIATTNAINLWFRHMKRPSRYDLNLLKTSKKHYNIFFQIRLLNDILKMHS